MISKENLKIGQLQIIKMLKMNKVFLVRQGNDYAVIKGESIELIGRKKGAAAGIRGMNVNDYWGGDTPQVKKSIEIGSDIISYVTADVGGVYALKTKDGGKHTEWVNKLIATPNIPWKNGFHHVEVEIKRMIDDKMIWMVMDAYNNLEDFSGLGLEKNSILTKKGHSVQIVLNRDPTLFNTLGRIVILDYFLGNTDRFWYDSSNKMQPGKIANLGNIFVTWDVHHAFRFIGVDFFSLDSGYSFLGVDWAQIHNKEQMGFNHSYAKRHFLLLKRGKTSERKLMGKALINALKQETQLIIGLRAEKAFCEGMHEGRELLKQYYKQEINKPNWPKGLESRFRALGW